MRLIKIGDTFINLDLVTEIQTDERTVFVTFAAPMGTNTTQHARFDGEEAVALLEWLDSNATHVAGPGVAGEPRPRS
ncbi:MAG: hypothetical protein H0X37_08015 [Herpetosiphonaceae bacterium]|nr:hypothetical protein [Herpetosiphonaceae bacterium]